MSKLIEEWRPIGSIGKSIKRGVNKVFNYYFKYGN